METEFKVGDKVRIISSNNDSQNCVGEIGTISEVDTIKRKTLLVMFRVKVPGRSNMANWHDASEVELIPIKNKQYGTDF